MAWTEDDVVRSLRRYVAEMLDDWVIRLQREEVRDDERPAAVIEAGVVSAPMARAAIDQGDVENVLPVTFTAYPSMEGSVRDAGKRARDLKQHLSDLITYGLDLGDDAGGRPLAGPFRIPLYDYADVALSGPDRAGPVEPGGRILVRDHSADDVQDPIDPKRWTVVLELRLAWYRPGRRGPVGEPLRDQPLIGTPDFTGQGHI
jgi:hypothetical protein